MCGSGASLRKAYVEGTLLRVCDRCSNLGKVVEDLPAVPQRKPVAELKESVIDPDFASIVRDARKSAGMTVEELSGRVSVGVSVLHRIENGMRPTDDVARRLEKALHIKILGFVSGTQQKTSGQAPPLTLGDVAEVKIRKK